jgi:NAD(P)H-quinone oxidoreductase subunit 5
MTQFFSQTAWLIPCYPFVGMLLSVLWFPSIIRRTGPRPAGYVNLVMTFLALVHGVIASIALWDQPAQYQFLPWLHVAGLDLTLPLEISSVTLSACTLVTGLNFLAQIYAVGYLEMDWGWARFFSLLALFEAGMTGLILCDSLFFSYIVLEILTLGTYLLIGVWFNQSLVVTGARDAFLTKRIGDLFLLMGVLALYPLAGTWDFQGLAKWAETAEVDPTLMALVGLALIAGPMGKCAQFPLHLWLDEAMEGPIPSTILRNSVVVATGAWILVKLEPVLALSPFAMTATTVIGALTALGGTLIAIAQIDVKRALSYSVSAYMGLVFIGVGTGNGEAALLLIFPYAIAMALLVMSTGSIVLNCITQDLTQLGGLWSRRPVTGLAYLVGAAGLVAFPPLGGFWALYKLIDGLWENYPLLAGVVLVVNGLTAFSLMREFGLIFGGQPKLMTERAPEPIWLVVVPMVTGAGFTLHVPQMLSVFGLLPDWTVLSSTAGTLLIWSTLIGAGVGAFVYLNPKVSKPIQLPATTVQNLLSYDFYTPKIYRNTVVAGVDVFSRFVDWCDRYLVDGLVNFVGIASIFSGEALKYNNSGKAQSYFLTITVGVVAILIIISFSFFVEPTLIAGLG